MTKKITRCYFSMIVILIGLLLVVGFSFSSDRINQREGKEVVHIENVETAFVRDDSAVNGSKMIYSFTIPELDYGFHDLAIYTTQQNVKVLIGSEAVYEREISDENLFGVAPGRLWNIISLNPKDEGEQVLIEITSPYQSNIRTEPKIYIGVRGEIYRAFLKKNLIPLFLGIIIFCCGVGLILYAFLWDKKEYGRIRLDSLGIFAVIVGIWLTVDVLCSVVDNDTSILFTYVNHIALLLMLVPFVTFVRGLFVDRNSKVWDGLCIASFIQILLEMILMFSGVADLKQMFWLNGLLFGVMILIIIIMALREQYHFGMSESLRNHLICLVLFGISVGIDYMRYFLYQGSTIQIVGSSAFLCYLIFIGFRSVRETNALIRQGREANRFRKMAYQDGMTGVYNRVAFEEAIDKMNRQPENCIIVMFDLNDLKKCNDVLGHKAGDRYLIESANLITELFDGWGFCYRIGGDEFCVITKKGTVADVEYMKEKIDQQMSQTPESGGGFQKRIACGYARYDQNLDLDLNDTRGRADAAMYRNKAELKKSVKN